MRPDRLRIAAPEPVPLEIRKRLERCQRTTQTNLIIHKGPAMKKPILQCVFVAAALAVLSLAIGADDLRSRLAMPEQERS